MNFYGENERFEKKPVTLFYAYLILTTLFIVNWIHYLYSWYFGDQTIIEEMLLPEILTSFIIWFMRLFGWITIPIFLYLTIHWYRVTKFGVKSTWKK